MLYEDAQFVYLHPKDNKIFPTEVKSPNSVTLGLLSNGLY